jgi:hypothetical protein
MMSNDVEFTLHVPVHNDWRSVDQVRSSVETGLSAALPDEADSVEVAMVAAELLENALKYGRWQGAGSFRIRVRGGRHATVVEVENPVEDDDAHASEVFTVLRWIAKFPTAEDAYRERLLALAADDRGPTDSGLGLVRIAYEAGAALEAELEAGVLRVRATMPPRSSFSASRDANDARV